MQIDVVNNNNEKVGAIDVRDEVFGGRVNAGLIWESVVRQNASERQGTHMTKTRGLVAHFLGADPRERGREKQEHGLALAKRGTEGDVLEAVRGLGLEGEIRGV